MKLSKKNLLIMCSILAFLLVGFIVFRLTTFRVVGTTPGTSKVSVISSFIDINFSKPIRSDSVSVRSLTTPLSGHEVIDKTSLRVYFDNLVLDSENSIIIDSIESTTGNRLQNIEILFRAQDIPFEKMSKSQQSAILDNQDRPTPTKSDPILQYLPYGGLNFELSSFIDGTDLKLKARLLLTSADVRIDENMAVEQYKKQVADYISSLELDANKYTIEYEVVKPGLY